MSKVIADVVVAYTKFSGKVGSTKIDAVVGESKEEVVKKALLYVLHEGCKAVSAVSVAEYASNPYLDPSAKALAPEAVS